MPLSVTIKVSQQDGICQHCQVTGNISTQGQKLVETATTSFKSGSDWTSSSQLELYRILVLDLLQTTDCSE